MSGVGPPAIRPRPYAWRRRSKKPPICLGLGPQPHPRPPAWRRRTPQARFTAYMSAVGAPAMCPRTMAGG
eukprot:gene21761-biopygen7150